MTFYIASLSLCVSMTLLSGSTYATTDAAVQQIPTSIIDIPQTAESIDKVRKLELEGEKLFNAGVRDKALAKWQEAYGLSIEMKYSEGEGRALTNMARTYLDRGDWIKAKYLGENALEVLGNSNDKRALGRARVALAQAYFGLGNNDWAGQQLSEAIKTFTNEDAGDAGEAAKLLSLAGNVLVRYGKVKEAVKFFQQSAIYFQQANNYEDCIEMHVQISNMLRKFGLCMAALEESQKGVDAANSQTKPDVCMAAYCSLANSQYVLGEFAKAKNTYEQALTMATKVPAKQLTKPGLANLELGYAYALLATGDYDQARKALEFCQPIFKGVSNTSEAETFNALGVLEETSGQHSKAIGYFSQALELQQVIRPPQPRLQVSILQNLAFAEARNGANRDARVHLEAALAFFKKKGPAMQLLEARTHAALAEIFYKLSDAAQSENSARTAIKLATTINDDASLWRDYVNLAKLQLIQGDNNAAKESLNSALSFFRSPQAGLFSSPESLDFASTSEDLGQQMVAMLARLGMGSEALLASEQLKEENFSNDFLKRGAQVKAEDKDVFNDLVIQRAHLHAAETFEIFDPQHPLKLVKEWQDWLGRFKTLIAQNRPLARMIAPVPNRISDIVKTVQATHATFVEYCVGADSSVVFTLDNSGRLSATVLPVSRKQLQAQVSSLLAQGTTSGEQPAGSSAQRERQILQLLYSELFPPSVRANIPKTAEQTICVIPDGVLFNLPFAALVDEQGKFVVENHTLTMACSMGALLDVAPKYVDDNSIVVTSLANAPDCEMICNAFRPDAVTKLMGNQADLSDLREVSRGKAMIHFAGKLSLLSNNPFGSLLPLVPNKDTNSKKVTAENLFATNVPSDLAVWGASSINAKDVSGNSVRVFSRGLSYAGIRNLILGLWSAPDGERTSELVEFYKQKQSGLSQAHALRKAELIAISKDPSPHSWASFQLLGPGY
jgi:tetratricopeptide (TPR) repeat protein